MFPIHMKASWMLWLQNPKLSCHYLFTAVWWVHMLFSLSMLGNSTWSLRHRSVYSLWINNFKNLSFYWFSSDFIIGPLHIFSRSYTACRNNNYKKSGEFVIAFLTLIICQNPEDQEAKRCYLFFKHLLYFTSANMSRLVMFNLGHLLALTDILASRNSLKETKAT